MYNSEKQKQFMERTNMFLLFSLIVIRSGYIWAETSQQTLLINPKDISLFDDEESVISVTISHPNTTSQFTSDAVNAKIEEKSIAQIISLNDHITKTYNESTYTFGIKIIGNKIGRIVAVFNFTDSRNSSVDYIVSNFLAVVRRRTVFDNILSYVLELLVINNFGFGCNFDYTVGKELLCNRYDFRGLSWC